MAFPSKPTAPPDQADQAPPQAPQAPQPPPTPDAAQQPQPGAPNDPSQSVDPVLPLLSLAATVKAAELWFHAAHHAVAGVSFVGDHALLGDIYTKAGAEFDSLVERAVGLSGIRAVAEPLALLSAAARKLQEWPSPVDVTDTLMAAAMQVNQALVDACDGAAATMEQSGLLTRGTDNMLAQMSDDHEGFAYKLGQRNG